MQSGRLGSPLVVFLLPLALLVSAGCNKPADTASAVAPAAPAPASDASKLVEQQQIQNNPNIPPRAKAIIAARMQGKGTIPK